MFGVVFLSMISNPEETRTLFHCGLRRTAMKMRMEQGTDTG
jgi:hypothetical protein